MFAAMDKAASPATAPYLPKQLGPFPGWRRLLGPGLIWMALAQGSGELIWWPYTVAKYGLGFLFLLIPACLIQYPLVFEIGRYTVLTGEGVFRGFFRLNRSFGILLWVLLTISFLWFGDFAKAGATAFAALTQFPRGWSTDGQILFWAQLSILIFTAAILYARSVYRLIEWFMRFVAIGSLVGMLVACAHPAVRAQIGPFLKGLFVPDIAAMRSFDPATDATRLLTAVAFVGLGGFWTLMYSYWIKEKGVAMAEHAQTLVGFRSGVSAIRVGEPVIPRDDPGLAGRLERWYRYLSLETLIGVLGNLLTTILACLLAFAILRPRGLYPVGDQIAVVQAEFFAEQWGHIGRMLFWLIAGAFLADTWLGTADGVARFHLDGITTIFPSIGAGNLRPWYYGLVLALAGLTSVTLYVGQQPGHLILVSGVIGFIGTVIYSAALLLLNFRYLRRRLPASIRPGRISMAALTVVIVIYVAFACVYLYMVREEIVRRFTLW